MKKLLLLLFSGFICFSCSDDDKAIDRVFAGTTFGAVARTVEFIQADLDVNNPEDRLNILIEQQDAEEGDLLESITIYAQFVDNDAPGGTQLGNEVVLLQLPKAELTDGPFGLPRLTLNFSLADFISALSLNEGQLSCDDQFILRLQVNLTDGRNFTTGSTSSCVMAFETFFSSPYRYIVNLVDPISPDLFTGTYRYTSVLDGPFGPTFGPPHLVEVKAGPTHNTRTVQFPGPPDDPVVGGLRTFYFTIGCNASFFWENQLRKNSANCSEAANDILLGPDAVYAPLSPLEDSVIELWLVEGYLGFDGSLGFGTVPSRIRLDKQ